MIKLYKFFLGIIIIVFFIFTTFFYLQYKSINSRVVTETRQKINEEIELKEKDISYWVKTNKRIVNDAAEFISKYAENDEEIYEYLNNRIKGDTIFEKLYYGKEDNSVIVTEGWNPQKNYMPTKRQWYIGALKEKEPIVTDVYKDQLTGEMTVSISNVVINNKGKVLGVIAGDISLKALSSRINIDEYGFAMSTFIVDENNEIVIQPKENRVFMKTLFSEEYIYKIDKINDNPISVEKTKIGDELGSLTYKPIGGTNWIIAIFEPINMKALVNNDLRNWYLVTFFSWLVILIVLLYVFNKYLLKPVMVLEKEVESIDIEKNSQFRMDTTKTPGFEALAGKINKLLDRNNCYIAQIKEDKEIVNNLNYELRALFENSPSGIVYFDRNQKIININKNFVKVFGYVLEEIKGRYLDRVLNPENKEVYSYEYKKKVLQGKYIIATGRRYKKDKTSVEVRIIGIPIIIDDIVVGGYGIYTDISKEKKIEQEIMRMSYQDQLTGLYNRRFFEEEIARLDISDNLPISLIMIDVNGLKLVNDAFGHAIGDELLQKTAGILLKSCRSDEIVSRHGGDEFVILLPKTSKKEAEILLKRIKKNTVKEKFEPFDISLSVGVATKINEEEQITNVFKNAEDRMYKQKLYESPNTRGSIINAIIATLNEKNKREEEHSKRVSELSGKIGEAMGFADEKITELRTLGHLHDIGKVAISESILNKEGKLTDEEWETIKKHPEIGYRILSEINELSEMAEFVLAHHERCDGSGYPKGLKSDEIPLFSKIIAVADSFDAMTSQRTYKKQMTEDQAIEELRRCSNTQFAPVIVEVFIKKVLGRT